MILRHMIVGVAGVILASCAEVQNTDESLTSFAPFACGGLYLAQAENPGISAEAQRDRQQLASGLVTATSRVTGAPIDEISAEMQEWRDEWIREAQTDWAKTDTGRAETLMLQAECDDLVASLPETRSIRR